MVLLPLTGFSGVFGTLAVACIIAAVLLLRVPKFLAPPQEEPLDGFRGDGRRLAPLLLIALMTAVAEAGAVAGSCCFTCRRRLSWRSTRLHYLPAGRHRAYGYATSAAPVR